MYFTFCFQGDGSATPSPDDVTQSGRMDIQGVEMQHKDRPFTLPVDLDLMQLLLFLVTLVTRMTMLHTPKSVK